MHATVSLVNCLVGFHWYGHQVNLYIKEVCSVVDLEVVALEKFVNLVQYSQVVVLSWSSNG